MNIFLAGTPVTLTVPLQDRNGNPLEVAALEYRVVDQGGTELVPRTALDTFAAGSSEAVIDISAEVNAIAPIPDTITASQLGSVTVREIRTVELFLNLNSNTILLTESYALEPADVLVAGLNSFQGFPQAELTALDLPGLNGWNGASDKEKIAALIDARAHICQLSFSLLNSNSGWGQDSLNYAPEGARPSPFAFDGSLSLLTPDQFNRLPARFKEALFKAQVAEADAILGGDPVDVRRQEGLMLESIGEVKQMFRPGKPLDLPVSKRALRYLNGFVTFSKRIGRS